MAIATEQIFTVCDNLWAEGEMPTNTKVRKALGKGSFSTISKAIREWKETRQPEEIADTSIQLSPEAELVVKRLITTIYNDLADSETREQIATLEGENENYQAINADLTRELDELKGYKSAYDVLRRDYEASVRENENLRKGISPDNAELIGELSADRDRLDSENQQLKEQTAELETTKALLLEAKQAREAAETEAREWRSQLAAMTPQLEAEKERAKSLENGLNEATKQISELRMELDRHEGKLHYDAPDRQQLVDESWRLKRQVEALEKEKKELERQAYINSLSRPWEGEENSNTGNADTDAIDSSAQLRDHPETEELEETSSPVSLDETSEEVTQKEPELHPKTPETEVTEEGDRQPMMVLKKQELADRLGVKQNTLNRPLNNGKFPEWSANKDPEGLQWERIGEGREARFVTYG